jgi:hypothetical protein
MGIRRVAGMAWNLLLMRVDNSTGKGTVIWLFGQFRWSSCNKRSFRRLVWVHLLGAVLEPSLPFRMERVMAHTCNPCLSWYHDPSWQPVEPSRMVWPKSVDTGHIHVPLNIFA